MTNRFPTSTQQPMIVKYVQPYRNGIQSHNLSRHSIGYILRGKKYIYYGDVRHEVNRGDLFYLGTGHHYTEDIPENGYRRTVGDAGGGAAHPEDYQGDGSSGGRIRKTEHSRSSG